MTALQALSTIEDRIGSTAMNDHECWEKLASEPLGRLAINLRGHPHLVPINHLVDDREILFVALPGSLQGSVSRRPGLPAVFEIDRYDSDTPSGWSVVVRGNLHVVVDLVEQARLDLRGRPIWLPGIHWRQWIRLIPQQVNGHHLHQRQSSMSTRDPKPGDEECPHVRDA